jgi:pimeloyl-ACP methyl ester carboxylesterase
MKSGADSDGAAFRRRSLSAQDGLELSFRDYGDTLSPRHPLLCLSGLTRNSKDFHDLAGHHAAARRIVALDYRGRGRSDYDPDPGNYRPEVYVSDILQLLAAANLHDVVVIGTSLGGLLAMGLATVMPTALAGVILNDVGPTLEPEASRRIVKILRAVPPQPDWPAAVSYLKRTMPQLNFATEAKWRRFAEATYRPSDDGRLRPDWDPAILRNLGRDVSQLPDLWRLYRALGKLPVLAVRGEASTVLSEETFQRMAAENPDLVQVTVPRVGHAPALDEPLVEKAIDDFLSRIDG